MRWKAGQRAGRLIDMESPAPLHLRRIDPARNSARFYSPEISPSLFGELALVRRWGRIGYQGRQIIELHTDHAGAVLAFAQAARRKQKRGYVPIRRWQDASVDRCYS